MSTENAFGVELGLRNWVSAWKREEDALRGLRVVVWRREWRTCLVSEVALEKLVWEAVRM